MPCRSDYLEADPYEKEMSRVYCLLDEIDGVPVTRGNWDGYHPNAYQNKYSKNDHDKAVAKLCAFLTKNDPTRAGYSLEMQIWWRDHQLADKERLTRDKQVQEEEKIKKQALSKLTPQERKLLKV